MTDSKKLIKYNEIRDKKINSILCHAPFISMNFEQNGNVSACCLNRDRPMGTYPENSISEMWFGPKARQLRNTIRKNILPKTCSQCRFELLFSENYTAMYSLQYDWLAEESYPEKFESIPIMPKIMEFELSNECNLECIMCNGHFSSAIRKNKESLPPLKSPYDEMFVKQLEMFIPHLEKANFLGGEPFLIDQYYQIWALIVKLKPDIKVSITTNGTILTKKVKKVLGNLNASIIISIDAFDKETYEKIRINANYNKVRQNLYYFIGYTKQKNTDLTIAVCPMQQNWKMIPDILSFCNKHEIYIFFNTLTAPVNASLRSLDGEKLSEIIDFLESAKLPDGASVIKKNNANYKMLIQQLYTYGDFINVDSINEYKLLLKIFNGKFKTEEKNRATELINSAIETVLKRFANHKYMNPLVYDKASFEISPDYWTFPEQYFFSRLISQNLGLVYQTTGNGQNVKGLFGIYKTVFSILSYTGNRLQDNNLSGKIDRICFMVENHPAKNSIVEMILKTDIIFSMDILKTYDADQILQMINGQFV